MRVPPLRLKAKLMTNTLNGSDGTAGVSCDCNPDLRFINTVLTDMIVFARLNRLSGLEEDLNAARTRFVVQVGQSQGLTDWQADVVPVGSGRRGRPNVEGAPSRT